MNNFTSPLRIWKKVVPETWIDYNLHLTEGYYGVAFGEATDEFLYYLGFNDEYRNNKGTFYTVETRIRYLTEITEGSEIFTETLLLGFDAKRLHIHHTLFSNIENEISATQETMLLHVSKDSEGVPAVTEICEPVLTEIKKISKSHCQIKVPTHAGSGIKKLK